MKISIFVDITLCSPLKVNWRFGGPCRLHSQLRSRALLATCFMLASCLAYSSILKMEVICSSETSVAFQWTARRYIPEDRSLHSDYSHRLCRTLSTKLEYKQKRWRQTNKHINLLDNQMQLQTRWNVIYFFICLVTWTSSSKNSRIRILRSIGNHA
jgi:hypothetical protein